MEDVGTHGLSEPDAAAVLGALDRVLAGAEFRRSRRARDFLAYVVTETLAGRGDRLSQRTVGRRALGQGDDFDGTASASVRVCASRVRSGLSRFYAAEGASEAVRITVPSGGYRAVFEVRPVPAAPPPPVPGVAVVALTGAGGELAGAMAASLSESLTHRLSRQPTIRVVGPTASRGDARSTGDALGVSSVLDGSVVERAGAVRITVRLSATGSGEVVWSDERALLDSELVGFDAEDAWAREVAAYLGDATGLVVREELAHRPTSTADQATARLAFFSYVDRGSVDSLLRATELLDGALAVGPRTADLLAMRAAVANAGQAFGLGDRDEQLALAESLARESLAIDGANAHAHLVLGSVAHYRGEWDLAIEHAEQAVALAPDHPSYLVGAGNTLCGAGHWERGAELIREAHRLHPGLTGRTHTWLAAGHLVRGDDARALGEASRLPGDGGFVWGPLYRAMALAGLGHLDQARAEAEEARRMRPEVIADPAAYFDSQMRLTEAQRDRLVALVRRATSKSRGSRA
jgi:TolB-like protein